MTRRGHRARNKVRIVASSSKTLGASCSRKVFEASLGFVVLDVAVAIWKKIFVILISSIGRFSDILPLLANVTKLTIHGIISHIPLSEKLSSQRILNPAFNADSSSLLRRCCLVGGLRLKVG